MVLLRWTGRRFWRREENLLSSCDTFGGGEIDGVISLQGKFRFLAKLRDVVFKARPSVMNQTDFRDAADRIFELRFGTRCK